MKKTALNDVHHQLGAKMVEFAGYEMPVYYNEGINAEHEAIRKDAGIFDVSHMGEFFISGKGAADLVQYVTSNNSKKLTIGQAQYSCLPNKEGGIVDDLIVYRMEDVGGEKAYMLVVNASNIAKDLAWITEHNSFGAIIENRSDEYSLLALQGPKATEWLQELTDTPLKDIPFYSYKIGTVAGIPDTIISNTGYTGSGGFELYFKDENALEMWNQLMKIADKYNAIPCGLGARDTLRLEMGYCLYGNDLSDTTSPIEAGLSWIVKTKIKSDFIAKDIFIVEKAKGVERKLMGFVVDSRRIPRKDYKIYSEDGNTLVGEVTSGTMSPILKKPIGMGYIQTELAKVGQKVMIEIGRKKHEATLARPPFVEV